MATEDLTLPAWAPGKPWSVLVGLSLAVASVGFAGPLFWGVLVEHNIEWWLHDQTRRGWWLAGGVGGFVAAVVEAARIASMDAKLPVWLRVPAGAACVVLFTAVWVMLTVRYDRGLWLSLVMILASLLAPLVSSCVGVSAAKRL
jgi:hypothetical protein